MQFFNAIVMLPRKQEAQGIFVSNKLWGVPAQNIECENYIFGL